MSNAGSYFNVRNAFFEIKFYSREPISKEFGELDQCWQKSKHKGYLNYAVLNSSNINIDERIFRDQREMDKDGKELQADLKSVDQITKSFDEIINLFYEIQKHKREKKQAGSSQFGTSKRFDASSTVSSIQKDFFVSKVDVGAVQFSRKLAEVVNSFFSEYLRTSVGILPLIDAFIEFNKHRGTDVVSSKEFKEACSLLDMNKAM